MTTEYSARTSYQTFMFEDYTFLITRCAWFYNGIVSYTYNVYEPAVSMFSSPDAYHSSTFRALGQTWGNLDSYFPDQTFKVYPSWTWQRLYQVRIYQGFRQDIIEWLTDEAIHRAAWQPLPLD